MMIIITTLLLLFPFINSELSFGNYKNDDRLLKFKLGSNQVHAPIVILNNLDFENQANAEGWPGNGSQLNPYIIQGFNFTEDGINLIEITSTTVYFIITKNQFFGAGYTKSGVFINNASNGMVIDNYFTKLGAGVYFYNSTNIYVSNNFYDDVQDAVLTYFSQDSIISNETVLTSYHNNIRVHDSNSITIENCRSLDANGWGIASLDSFNTTLINNTVIGNGWGIEFLNSPNGVLINNSVSKSVSYIGISVSTSPNTTIERNTVFSNFATGISSSYSENITLIDNKVFDNSFHGISLTSSHNSQISNNLILKNDKESLKINFNDNTTVKNNIFENHSLSAIVISEQSDNNTIINNDFIRNIHSFDLISQVENNGQYNTFISNFWNDWPNSDLPYKLMGNYDSHDASPRIWPNRYKDFFITIPTSIIPMNSTIYNSFELKWIDVIDSENNTFRYTASIINESNESVFSINTTENKVFLNITSLDHDYNYYIIIQSINSNLVCSTFQSSVFNIRIESTSSSQSTTITTSSSDQLSSESQTTTTGFLIIMILSCLSLLTFKKR
jgi:parallel beta-helix repeat protein